MSLAMRQIVIAVSLLAAASATAMSIHTEDTELARSDDGKVVLIERVASGPEGGGSTTYVLRHANAHEEAFEISSDFSPGDGSTPQRITAAACTAALEQLAKKTAGWKRSVVTHPEICRDGKRRGDAVSIAPKG
jgi:hypothetical protein